MDFNVILFTIIGTITALYLSIGVILAWISYDAPPKMSIGKTILMIPVLPAAFILLIINLFLRHK